jgi:hypothetical protein
VRCFLLFAWSTLGSIDCGAGFRLGSSIVLRLDWATIRDTVRQEYDSSSLGYSSNESLVGRGRAIKGMIELC